MTKRLRRFVRLFDQTRSKLQMVLSFFFLQFTFLLSQKCFQIPEVPPSVKEDIDRMWNNMILPVTGCATYEVLVEKMITHRQNNTKTKQNNNKTNSRSSHFQFCQFCLHKHGTLGLIIFFVGLGTYSKYTPTRHDDR